MDRRAFVQRALLLAAGSAIGCSVTGCNSELNIPCLGPAAEPERVPGMMYIRASEIGCALDCDLRTGHNKLTGGAATDDGPRINAALAGATPDNPITLIIDGSALISGLFLPAGGHWSIAGLGCGTGFFVKKGTNNDGIHNGDPNAAIPSDPGPPAPPRGMNVSLSNFTLNGNRGDGRSGDSTSGHYQGNATGKLWYFGINLMNLDNIRMENVVVVNVPTYHVRLSNVGNVAVTGCVLQTEGLSSDGLHFDGPANDITISNCDFRTGDDSIALNAPEGHSGNISRMTVTNCTFNSLSLMRIYTVIAGSTNRFNVDTVSVSNCSGTLSEAAFLIGFAGGSNPNSVTGLTVSDCNLTAPVVLGVAENFGNIVLKNVTFVPSQSHVSWVAPQSSHTSAFLRPSPLYGGITVAGSSLLIEGCTVFRNSNTKVAGVILDSNSTIDSLHFNGLLVVDQGSYSPVPELLIIGPASVGGLVLDSVDSNAIKSPVANGFSNIKSVSGAGVLATGWKFPDAVMANGVPYISADSGLPSIKVAGLVQPYPQP